MQLDLAFWLNFVSFHWIALWKPVDILYFFYNGYILIWAERRRVITKVEWYSLATEHFTVIKRWKFS